MTYIPSHKLPNFWWNIIKLCPFFDLEILCWVCRLSSFFRNYWERLDATWQNSSLCWSSFPDSSHITMFWNNFQIMPLFQLRIPTLSFWKFKIFQKLPGQTSCNFIQRYLVLRPCLLCHIRWAESRSRSQLLKIEKWFTTTISSTDWANVVKLHT